MTQKISKIYNESAGEHFLKKNDFLVSLLFDRPITVPIVRLMQKLDLKVHPSLMSLMSLPFALLAGFLFFNNKLVVGAMFYLIYFIIDGVDGKWARLTCQTSKLGERLDFYIAVIGGFAMYFGLWYSQFYCNYMSIIGVFGIFSHYTVVALYGTLLKNPFYNTGIPVVGSYYTPEEEAFFTFFIATVINIVPIAIPVLVSFQAISFMILFIKQREKPSIEEIRENVIKRLFKLQIE